MKFCLNNTIPGRKCLSGFRKLPDDYFYSPYGDKMLDLCRACQREKVDNIRLWAEGKDPDPEGPPIEVHTSVYHRNFTYREEDFEIGDEPQISPEEKEQIKEWMKRLIKGDS